MNWGTVAILAAIIFWGLILGQRLNALQQGMDGRFQGMDSRFEETNGRIEALRRDVHGWVLITERRLERLEPRR